MFSLVLLFTVVGPVDFEKEQHKKSQILIEKGTKYQIHVLEKLGQFMYLKKIYYSTYSMCYATDVIKVQSISYKPTDIVWFKETKKEKYEIV